MEREAIGAREPRRAGHPPPLTRRRAVLFALAATGLVALAGLATLEVGLRIYDAVNRKRELAELPPVGERCIVPSEDPELIFELNPGWSDGEFTVNSLGLADDEVTLEKPADVFRIAFVGDSITCNFGHRPRREIYLEVLERRLNELAPAGTRMQCLNFGVNGYGARQSARAAATRVPPFAPDLIVAQLCLNDPQPSDTAYSRAGRGPWLRSRSFFYRRLRPARFWGHSLVERHFAGDGPDNLRHAFRELAATAEGGPPVVAVLFPYLYRPAYDSWDFARFHRLIGEEAAAAGVPLIDLKSAFRDAGLIDERWPKDPIHPDAEGHRLAAEVLLVELARLAPGRFRRVTGRGAD